MLRLSVSKISSSFEITCRQAGRQAGLPDCIIQLWKLLTCYVRVLLLWHRAATLGLTESPFIFFFNFFHRLIFKNTAFRKPALRPSSGKREPNLVDPFGASLPEDGNRAGFRNVVFLKIRGWKKSPPPKKRQLCYGVIRHRQSPILLKYLVFLWPGFWAIQFWFCVGPVCAD